MSNLDIELGRSLFQQRPRLLECADEETAEALNALAATMGCLLATVKARSGEKDFRQALRLFVTRHDLCHTAGPDPCMLGRVDGLDDGDSHRV